MTGSVCVVNSVVAGPARRLSERHTAHPVISLYLDLDPERFATAPARAAQIRSLVDQAARELDEAGDGLSHDSGRLSPFLRGPRPLPLPFRA